MAEAADKPVGYLLGGTRGRPRDRRLTAYYHRADRLREAAERSGLRSLPAYTARSTWDRPSFMRLLRCSWVRRHFEHCRAVYGGAPDPTGLAAWALRKTDVPVLFDVHTPGIGEKWLLFRINPRPRTLRMFVEACLSELICIRHSDVLLWSSLIQKDYYTRRGFPVARMRGVRHGVDLAKFDIGPPVQPETPKLCYAGTMIVWQGADKLVEAYERVGKRLIHLKMIGFADSDAALRRRAEAAGIETVSQVSYERLPDELRDCHGTSIIAHPDAARYKNGAAPTKWPESLALGRPILSVDAYDTAQLIRELRVGWVVESSVEGLMEGMRRLSETPWEELKQMGLRARAEAERNYAWETVGRRFVEAIENATKRRPGT
ncbi:MAG: glycosyltransferase [Armatimonadetes bacterium]|nr:glycosyltransferase [Armatimonadota bacterium]